MNIWFLMARYKMKLDHSDLEDILIRHCNTQRATDA